MRLATPTQVLADANFPAASVAASTPAGLVNCDGSVSAASVACACAQRDARRHAHARRVYRLPHRAPHPPFPDDEQDMPTLLTAIMALLPLDETCSPAITMAMMPEHIAAGWKTPIIDSYKTVGRLLVAYCDWPRARERRPREMQCQSCSPMSAAGADRQSC